MTAKNPYPDDTNPKDLLGVKKAPVHLVPPALVLGAAEALADGARKYGAYNWREKSVKLSVYMAAFERHRMAFWDGEDVATDSQVHHLKHMVACLAIVLDAAAIGKLVDDRPTAGGAPRLLAEQDGISVVFCGSMYNPGPGLKTHVCNLPVNHLGDCDWGGHPVGACLDCDYDSNNTRAREDLPTLPSQFKR